jgi:hypothetical protein
MFEGQSTVTSILVDIQLATKVWNCFWIHKQGSQNLTYQLSIPNRLEFMHKIIATGVHEIAALVVPFIFARRLGTMFVPRREAL